MSTTNVATSRLPVSDRALSLALVAALHLAVGVGLAHLASQALAPAFSEPVHIELLPAPPVAEQKQLETPKPLPALPRRNQEKSVRKTPAAPASAAEPVIQTNSPTPSDRPAEMVAPPARDTTPAVPASAATGAPAAAGNGISESIQAPRFDTDYLHNPAPAYPKISRNLGEEGRVMLRVQVSDEGKALQVLIETGSGFSRLDRAAQEAVANWRFVPARQGQRNVAGWVKVPVVFELKN